MQIYWIHLLVLIFFGGFTDLDAFYFFVLSAVARTSSTTLNNSGESAYPYLVPHLRGTASSLLLFSMMLAVGLSYVAFVMLRYLPCIPILLRVFIVNEWWSLSNAFSASVEFVVLFFLSVYVVDGVYRFSNVFTILASLGWIPLDHGVWSS